MSKLLNRSNATVLFILVIAGSCTKATLMKNNSLAGDWVLESYDSAGTHIKFPQDANTNGFPTWAAHLILLQNDSVYWNNCGVDATPFLQLSGTYISATDSLSNQIISFKLPYPIGAWSSGTHTEFYYAIKNGDSLLLKVSNVNPATYTYARK